MTVLAELCLVLACITLQIRFRLAMTNIDEPNNHSALGLVLAGGVMAGFSVVGWFCHFKRKLNLPNAQKAAWLLLAPCVSMTLLVGSLIYSGCALFNLILPSLFLHPALVSR